MAPARSASSSEAIVAELEDARQSLAANIDAIGERVSPSNMARRTLRRARAVVQAEDGSLKIRNVGILVGVASVLVVYAVRKPRL